MEAVTLIGGPRNGEKEWVGERESFIHVDYFPDPATHVAGTYRRVPVSTIFDHLRPKNYTPGKTIFLWEKEGVKQR